MKRITPEVIDNPLPPDVVFVFGSNELGLHGAGAALLANKAFGYPMGMGLGFAGRAFGIPTKDFSLDVLPLREIGFYVERFLAFAKRPMSSKWKFYVTKIGCGLAGYKPEDIAPLFAGAENIRNVWLPQEFIDVLEKSKVDGNNAS